jgi:hypothetical protein
MYADEVYAFEVDMYNTSSKIGIHVLPLVLYVCKTFSHTLKEEQGTGENI